MLNVINIGKDFIVKSQDFCGDSRRNFTAKFLVELSFSHGYLAKLADSSLAYFSRKHEIREI